jgi:hypothetical protein
MYVSPYRTSGYQPQQPFRDAKSKFASTMSNPENISTV